MKRPGACTALEDLGRQRLSRHFFMRIFLHSEIGKFFGRPNIPDDPDPALAAGRAISSYVMPKGKLLAEGAGPVEGPADRRARHADFPAFRGIVSP